MKEEITIKKYRILLLSIIVLIGTFLVIWYANEINLFLLLLLDFILILLIAALFYYTIKHIKEKEYLDIINIFLLLISIFIFISPFIYPIYKVKAEVEFNKYEKKINEIRKETKSDNYKNCNNGICIVDIPIERRKNYTIYRNDIEVQLIEFPLISETLSLVYSNKGIEMIKEVMPVYKINNYKDNWFFVTKED